MPKPKTIKARKFRLHFNRINMQRGKDTVWTIHRSDRCIPARQVRVYVETETVFRPESTQPRAWFQGEGVVVDCQNGDYCITSPQMAFALMQDAADKGDNPRYHKGMVTFK